MKNILKKNIFSRVAVALVTMAALFSSASHASLITKDFSSLGKIANPGQISWDFSTPAGFAYLAFELVGYNSLDGYKKSYSDTFHLRLNGAEIFTGSFNMGGGGSNKIIFNPNGGTALTTTNGSTGNVHNSTQVTWSGGTTDINLPIILLSGANKLEFSYSGYQQPLNDEWWGVNLASITTMSASESSSIILLGIGLLGVLTLRRKSFD